MNPVLLPEFNGEPRGAHAPTWFTDVLSGGDTLQAFDCDWDLWSQLKRYESALPEGTAVTRSFTDDITAALFQPYREPGKHGVLPAVSVYWENGVLRVNQWIRSLTIVKSISGDEFQSRDGQRFALAEMAYGCLVSRYQDTGAVYPPCLQRHYACKGWVSFVADTERYTRLDNSLYTPPSNSRASHAAGVLFTSAIIRYYPEIASFSFAGDEYQETSLEAALGNMISRRRSVLHRSEFSSI